MKILLVEDDVRIVNFIKRGLEAERYGVDVAHDGSEAIEMGRGIDYSVIILDILLPVRNGLEVCRILREENIRTPILMLTAKDSLEDKVGGLKTGADDYLTKPFAFEELLARINALLRRGPYRDVKPELKVADLMLNQNSHEVRRGDKAISLTPTEFALLRCLMLHPDQVLSRTAILEQVWGYHYDTLTNVVDVYIRYLRRKIDDGFPKRLIQTVRDMGYKISGTRS